MVTLCDPPALFYRLVGGVV